MAAVWARAEVILDANGELLPAQVRRAATRAGIEGGKAASGSFTRSFSSGASSGMDSAMGEALKKVTAQFRVGGAWDRLFGSAGRQMAFTFGKGFGESAKTFRLEFDKVSQEIVSTTRSIRDAVDEVDFGRWADDFTRFRSSIQGIGGDMDRLAIGPGFLEDIGELRQVFDETDENVRRTGDGFTILWRELESGTPKIRNLTDALEENGEAVKKTSRFWEAFNKASNNLSETWKKIGGGGGGGGGGILDGLNDSLGHHASLWKRLSYNTRQWTLIIGAVIGAMSQLAGLASAAGSGLFILVGALSGLITGGIFAGVAFARFLGDLERVPDAVKPAREAFDNFGKVVSDVMGEMTVHAFRDTERAWIHFGEVMQGLQPGFNAIGDVVNKLITDLSDNLDTSMVENLNGFLAGSATILDRVVRAVGRLGDALLVAFNNPTFQRALGSFLDYIDLITDRFAAFLTGPGFDEWIEHGEAVFGAFGSLLDTTGRLLNDLVTDETIGQLVDFIGNIERFLAGGGKGILDFAQELDIFGLIAEALADFGDALEPLAGPMKDFAEGLHDVIQSGIDTLAPIIEDIADALAPFVQGLADFMKANPKAVSDAIIALWGAFVLLKGVKLATIAADMLLFGGALAKGGSAVGAFNVGKLGRIAGGLAGIAAIAAAQLIPDSFWKQFDIESNLPANVLTGAGIGGMIAGPWAAAIGAGLGIVYSLFTEFETTMNDIGLRLAGTFVAGPWGTAAASAAEFFASLIPEEWATSDNPMERFVSEFATNVEEFGTTLTTAFDGIQTLFDGTTEGASALEISINTSLDLIATDFDTWKTDVTTKWLEAWTFLNSPYFWDVIAVSIGTWAGTLIAHFTTFSSGAQTTWTTFWALAFSPGLWTSIADSVGTTLGIMATYFSTKTQQASSYWGNFWNNISALMVPFLASIPSQVGTMITNINTKFNQMASGAPAAWVNFWNGLVSVVEGVVGRIIGLVGKIISAANSAAGASSGIKVPAGGGGGTSGLMAAGGLLMGPRHILAGEAGPEAVIPLRRPLSQVDPSVRWLSAIAQGKYPAMAGGGIVGGGKTLTVENININETGDSRRTANDVITRLAEYVYG